MASKTNVSLDIVGFGPIGRELAIRLVRSFRARVRIASISDSSGTIFPKNASEVLGIAQWKSNGRKISEWGRNGKVRPGMDVKRVIQDSESFIVVDVTNSDYKKAEEAKERTFTILDSGKNLVTASKVALSSYYYEIFSAARKKGLRIGFGATILGARNAVAVLENMDRDEVRFASAVLNSSTTLILSKLEEKPKMTFEEACKSAAMEGTLESDWSIDLDGIDAAAKTAIFGNVLFPKQRFSIQDVVRRGIRDEKAKAMLEIVRSGRKGEKVRLVSEITRGRKPSVAPRVLPYDSPLAVGGKDSVVCLESENFGEIVVKNSGGGVALTVSALLFDIRRIVGNG